MKENEEKMIAGKALISSFSAEEINKPIINQGIFLCNAVLV
jgi:hypothetical protein